VARSDFGHVTVAIHLLVLLSVLVVVVRLQRQLGTTNRALKASTVEEREVLQGAHAVHLVDSLVAPQTGTLVEVGPVHRLVILQHFDTRYSFDDRGENREKISSRTGFCTENNLIVNGTNRTAKTSVLGVGRRRHLRRTVLIR
jgi:hypothetical protein